MKQRFYLREEKQYILYKKFRMDWGIFYYFFNKRNWKWKSLVNYRVLIDFGIIPSDGFDICSGFWSNHYRRYNSIQKHTFDPPLEITSNSIPIHHLRSTLISFSFSHFETRNSSKANLIFRYKRVERGQKYVDQNIG